MPDFVPLAAFLASPAAPVDEIPVPPSPEPEAIVPADPDVRAAARDARLFSARLADALAHATSRLIADLAADVLARELRLAPADVDALAARVVQRAPVVRMRVALEEAVLVHALPVVADPLLEPGDVVFELDGGDVDARLGVRLADVLDEIAACAP